MILNSIKKGMGCLITGSILAAAFFTTQACASQTVKIAYVQWSSEIASSYLVKVILEEKMGYTCQLVDMRADEMWESVAAGKTDATVSAWLPDVHGHYYEQYKDRLENLGPNLEGTRAGLAVPDIYIGRFTTGTGLRNRSLVPIDTIAGLRGHADMFKNRIIGIDPEAGIMKMAKEAVQVYGLNRYRLVEGSEVSMLAELSHAIRHQRPVVVTAWTPHWIFARWELKFLEDPEKVFGDKGHINTIARKGLQKDLPEVYRFLDRFYWKPEQMGQLMLWNQQDRGIFPYENALRWIKANPETVSKWLQ